ncbi:hypothetical protein LCGC14_1283910 [marine sediment metagenome]|uniref:Uncharacterized protein n=2 Tax=root TaxID=1 RepID=A0A831QV97_9FLAO|nr:hypothetical protein [Pricia antarctica]
MKTVIQIVLWVVCIGLSYLIYQSITGPIRFNEVKEERFSQVIAKMKDIRSAQEAYKTVNRRYAKDFNSLIKFIDTANYTITQQRDSSYMEYDKTYQIDMLKEVKLIDTLGTVSVKDSLFGEDGRYKNLAKVPTAQNDEEFKMEANTLNKSGFRAPVFEVKVEKKVVLYDQPKALLDKENTEIGVDEVNGNWITVGSLSEVSTAGNWPPVYDKRGDQ